MARIRTIKPEFWTDSFMVQLPPLARLFYVALWTAADDHGFIRDEPDRIAMEVMPREDELDVDDFIQLFEASGRIERFVDEGHSYFRIAKWEDHQRVDKPAKSKICREASRKVAIPLAVRRGVAEKYGCEPGGAVDASCFYCGAAGKIHWWSLKSGKPSGWVTFPGLELDHLEAEAYGGETSAPNLVLACRNCNRHKGQKSWIDALSAGVLANIREPSREERKGREQGTGKGKEVGAMAPDEVIFSGTYVRTVTAKTVTAWLETFNTLDSMDLRAELALCDEYYAGQDKPPGNWFFTTMAWVKREHDRRMKVRRDADEAEKRIYAGVQ